MTPSNPNPGPFAPFPPSGATPAPPNAPNRKETALPPPSRAHPTTEKRARQMRAAGKRYRATHRKQEADRLRRWRAKRAQP
jgi:hypothetical protein